MDARCRFLGDAALLGGQAIDGVLGLLVSHGIPLGFYCGQQAPSAATDHRFDARSMFVPARVDGRRPARFQPPRKIRMPMRTGCRGEKPVRGWCVASSRRSASTIRLGPAIAAPECRAAAVPSLRAVVSLSIEWPRPVGGTSTRYAQSRIRPGGFQAGGQQVAAFVTIRYLRRHGRQNRARTKRRLIGAPASAGASQSLRSFAAKSDVCRSFAQNSPGIGRMTTAGRLRTGSRQVAPNAFGECSSIWQAGRADAFMMLSQFGDRHGRRTMMSLPAAAMRLMGCCRRASARAPGSGSR